MHVVDRRSERLNYREVLLYFQGFGRKLWVTCFNYICWLSYVLLINSVLSISLNVSRSCGRRLNSVDF